MATHTVDTFEMPLIPLLYDALVRSIYVPVGGEQALRQSAVQQLAITPGTNVLELGCGTGSFTRLLCAAGANVMSIDGSQRMIDRARSKAPSAKFEQQDLRQLRLPDTDRYDMVLLAFVLHELTASVRHEVLTHAASRLSDNGRIVIVDHAVPEHGGFARLWRSFLLNMEPATVRSVIERGYDDELRVSGLSSVSKASLAQGTAMLITAQPLRP